MNCLFVIDYQNDFVDGALGFPGAEKLDERIAEKVLSYGKGKVLFFNTQLFYGYHLSPADDTLALIKKLTNELSLEQLEVNGTVSARVATGDGKVLFFVFNYGDKDEYAEVSCKIDGKLYKASATVAANDSIIVEGKKI